MCLRSFAVRILPTHQSIHIYVYIIYIALHSTAIGMVEEAAAAAAKLLFMCARGNKKGGKRSNFIVPNVACRMYHYDDFT